MRSILVDNEVNSGQMRSILSKTEVKLSKTEVKLSKTGHKTVKTQSNGRVKPLKPQ